MVWYVGVCMQPGASSTDTRAPAGATTFRLKANGITCFLDTWLERPASLKHFLSIDDVTECDYIFISHAHFDQCVESQATTSHPLLNSEQFARCRSHR